jgi:8-oxo-dGTP diphosphatase
MAHIHTNVGEHDLTASAFIVRDDLGEPQILLHMHKKLNVLLQPGGHVELTENPWEAVEHEVREEAGYTFDELEVFQPKDRMHSLTGTKLHPAPLNINTHNFDSDGAHRHTDISFALLAHSAPSLLPVDGESKDVRWVTIEQLQLLSSSEIFEDVREICTFVLTTVFKDWERVSTKNY